MRKPLEEDISPWSPYQPGEAVRRQSEINEPGLRELAGNPGDRVRLPIQHGKSDDAMPAWTESKPETAS
ncbi:hypothetical protein HZB58_04555 [Candidatus Gottesmanbacteria bacterium]|nr:hypothetical protein [Candidatus Gottesmanbacteria bacterium]